MTEPGWLPDPSGRHQLRWFDGTRYTDQVADGGVQSTDPGPAVAVAGVVPPADVTGKRASRLPLILAAVGALVVIVAVVTLLGGDGGTGAGTFDGRIGDGREQGRHEISIPAGSAAIVLVEPSSDLDAIVGFEVDADDADRVEELYEDTPLAFAAEVDDDLTFRADVGFDGEEERTLLAVPFGVDATVVVSGFDDSEGDYEVTIDVVDLDLDDDADGNDVIDAVVENDDVPRVLREQIESLLGE